MGEHTSFGYWLRRRRKALDLTQEALAQQVGCALATIRKFEAAEREAFLRAARSLGAAEALRETYAIPVWPGEVPDLEQIVAGARAALDETTFAAARAAGRALGIEEALAV
jgi:transcriptional regulator with XRE-family HTH domain